MFSQIKDPIGRAILVIFLIKPMIDLGYFLVFYLGPIKLSPTTVFAALMCLYFFRFRFSRGSHVAPYSALLEWFILLNFLSIFVGIYAGSKISPVGVVNAMLRLLDSYLIYVAAFLAMSRYRYPSISPFVKAIVIGSAVAVFLNVLAIKFGFGGGVKGGGTLAALRERGLYYDPGALSNVAFFNLVFSVFLLHLVEKQKMLWILFIAVLVLADLYLINAGKSRAVMVEIALFGFVYLLLFQKRWGKIAAPFVAAATLLATTVVMDVDFSELFVRFEGDVAALGEADTGQVGTGATGDVSLGQFERLGNNRGANWAAALTDIFSRSPGEILLGNFSVTRAHSDYVDVLSRNGIVGLFMYCFLSAGLVWRTFRLSRRKSNEPNERVLHFIAFTLIGCYILYAIPFRPLMYTTTAWYMWTMLGFSMAAAKQVSSQQVEKQPRTRRQLVMTA